MRKYKFLLLCCCYCFFISCNTATPENYFDQAVLNANMLEGFAGQGFQYQLDNPTVKMAEGSTEPVAMKRKELVDNQIKFVEESLAKLKGLKETPETKDMLQTALSLNEFVLPVYKNDYQQLAKLYDDGAAKETITLAAQAIHDKYFARFGELIKSLITIGKAYATSHDIKVNWGVKNSP